MKKIITFESPIGTLWIGEENCQITDISFIPIVGTIEETNLLLNKCINELKEYFTCQRNTFDLPLNPQGTSFQKKVWLELLKIPYGTTISYQKIAESVGDIKKARAVGMANHNNPIPIIIPCHRVIGKNQKLTGYGGGLDKKQFLLELEKASKI